MNFNERRDAHYFLTMEYQEPHKKCDSHDPYVVLNRWRTLLVTREALDYCNDCESKQINASGVRDMHRFLLHLELMRELQTLYQEIDEVFASINAFAEKAVLYFDQHAQLCERCQTQFHAGVTVAQAMQDSIFENPETPDETWISDSCCVEQIIAASRHKKVAQLDQYGTSQKDASDVPVVETT